MNWLRKKERKGKKGRKKEIKGKKGRKKERNIYKRIETVQKQEQYRKWNSKRKEK